jgi:hypothetical protein
MSLYKVEKLIDLACSTTHPEEARTAALSACKLIRKHGMTISASSARAAPQYARREPPPPPPEAPREKPPNGGSWARASRASRCANCNGRISAGEAIYTVAGATWCARH